MLPKFAVQPEDVNKDMVDYLNTKVEGPNLWSIKTLKRALENGQRPIALIEYKQEK